MFVAHLKDYKAVWKAQGLVFAITPQLSRTSETHIIAASFWIKRKMEMIGHSSSSWQGFTLRRDMCYPIRYFIHLTVCTLMLPYFIVFVRVVLNLLTCILRVSVHMYSMSEWEVRTACQDKSWKMFSSSTVPIHLRFYCAVGSSVPGRSGGVWFRKNTGRGNEGLCWAPKTLLSIMISKK